MVNYGNGKIYKICSYQTNDIYIGATCRKYLSQRFQKHKSSYKYFLKCGVKKHITTSINLMKYDDAYIVLLENFPCKNKNELNAREAYYIRKNNCVNKSIPGRTPKEYYEENFEKIKEVKKIYMENNKEKFKKLQKKYCENNKEYIKKTQKEYYEKNKNKIFERIKKKYNCECGSVVSYGHKARHEKTKKHLKVAKAVAPLAPLLL